MSNNYRYIPPEQKKHVIKLAAKGWKPPQIADTLDMGLSTIKRVIRLWNTTGFIKFILWLHFQVSDARTV
jgi:hypothetical protein